MSTYTGVTNCQKQSGFFGPPCILTVGLSLRLLCPDLSDSSSLTERTSDNQRLGTSNDTASVAKQPTLKSQLD